jgi:hypothetical protein
MLMRLTKISAGSVEVSSHLRGIVECSVHGDGSNDSAVDDSGDSVRIRCRIWVARP